MILQVPPIGTKPRSLKVNNNLWWATVEKSGRVALYPLLDLEPYSLAQALSFQFIKVFKPFKAKDQEAATEILKSELKELYGKDR